MIRNKDNKYLEPIVLKKKEDKKPALVIGYYDEIHGEGAKKVRITLTQAQVEEIVKYYIDIILGIEAVFDEGQSGSYEIRWFPYAHRRLNYFDKLLNFEHIEHLFDYMETGSKEGLDTHFFDKKRVTITEAEKRIIEGVALPA